MVAGHGVHFNSVIFCFVEIGFLRVAHVEFFRPVSQQNTFPWLFPETHFG
jgi:hypothetical protein